MKILGMGWIEFLVILAIILIIFGPKQLPKLGRAIGKTVRNLKKGIGEDEEKQESVEPTSTEVAIVAVETPARQASAASQAAASVAQPEPAPAPAPSPAPTTQTAAPKVVKKTVVKKKAE